MQLIDLLSVIDEETEVEVWARDVDTQNPVSVGVYNGKDSIEPTFNNFEVTEVSCIAAGLIDVTIDCEVFEDSEELQII